MVDITVTDTYDSIDLEFPIAWLSLTDSELDEVLADELAKMRYQDDKMAAALEEATKVRDLKELQEKYGTQNETFPLEMK